MPFNFHARYALLTYAQSGGLDPFEVSNHIGSLGGECIVARESHADGGVHLHAFADFNRKRRFRSQTVFDVGGRHPNISPSRGHPWDGYDYAVKEGDIVAGGLERPMEKSVTGGSRDTNWTRIVEAETRDEFFELCKQLDPQRLVCSWPAICKYADHRYAPEDVEYSSPAGEFSLGEYPEMVQWANELQSTGGGVFRGRRKSLVLWGPTRTGKTVWARSVAQHLYFCGLFSGKDACGERDDRYAIFDDMQGGIGFFHGWKNWLGSQHEFKIKLLYRDPVTIRWGKPCVWISNSDPREGMSQVDIDWLEGNCIFVNVTTTIFHASTE
ncbi:MAG: replication-associated protein [Genomoviridae sp.]|uniref:replication-associated protein n=1 Tax=Genomoviridae sp. TaxID=2202565 RepID=UPI002481EDD1|nr:MAG: replication-associated protein [Genomoviridae sp.]QCW23656.1 MAG: replication-associated protein [Genomoviridae sp.]